MVKLDLYWKTNKEWCYFDEARGFVLREDAPLEAKESYKNYCKQLAAIDRWTSRSLVIPKNEAGVQLYEHEDPDWNRGSYETEKWKIFCIPYDEFCILREGVDIREFMEEHEYRLSGEAIRELIHDIQEKTLNVPQTLSVLKEATGYNTFVEYVEEHIL